MAIHNALPGGFSLWLDFSATPKDQNGTYFPWIICDYPLAQAVEDRIVKAPLIVHQVKRKDPETVTRKNVIEAYGEWLLAALTRWQEHYQTYKRLGPKPVLFIMAERNDFADEIGEWLVKTKETGLKASEVLVIHTDNEGEVTKKDLEKAREAARDIDQPDSKIKAVISVLMLREGWDVRNVTVVLGLRPFTSKAKILFNYVATYNDYEKEFARFLDRCPDILRFASLGTTEQESGTRFRVDYLKPSGAIGFYHPDWVAVQDTEEGEVNWIIETKGRVWEDTLAKDAAISDWCRKVSDQTGTQWRYLRVNQADFGNGNFLTFQDLMEVIR